MLFRLSSCPRSETTRRHDSRIVSGPLADAARANEESSRYRKAGNRRLLAYISSITDPPER